MVYEYLLGRFIPKDSFSKFSKLFQVVVIIVFGDILRLMALVLGASKLLAMVKDTSGLCPIAIGKVFLWFNSRSIILQLWGLFQEHLSPHEFGVLTFGGYKAIIFSIWALFDLHLDWAVMHINVKNAFNNIFQIIIFRKLCDAKGPLVNISPFTKLFYGVHSSFYFQHDMWKGSPLLIHFQAWGKVTP